MNKAQNTCKNEPPASMGKRISRKVVCVFRIARALFNIEPGPAFQNEKLPIIFANIRV